jgi:hypothetical protein
MNDKGFTMVPNAIIRSSELSVSDKAVWNFIASMPNGYRYTVRSACDKLHINEKTWCRCVCKLERKGLVSVKSVPGQTNVYEAVRDTPKCEETPTKIVGSSNGTPTKIAVPPPPNEYPTTHYNKKKQLNNNVDDDTRKKLELEVMIDLNIELACKSCGITAEEYRHLAEKIIADWKFQDLEDSEWTKKHFMSVLRHKVNDLKQPSNGPQNTTNTSKASNPLSRATIHTAKIG